MSEKWFPEICYEESDDGVTSKIPFIQVPQDQEMPGLLFVFESRDTGEVEPGPTGEELPVTQLDLHQYCNMATLKEKLTVIEYDNVRWALGLEPIKTAAAKGRKITSNVRVALDKDHTGNALDKE
tara:strand:+ start:149 stop:523 length:375 start_codon:yes stop_codon:yes gene_type:complete